MNQLTTEAINAIEKRFAMQDKAFELLDLIVAEWESDPMSVQCFDLRVVEQAKELMQEHKKLEKRGF
jgi:uncharacterized coiled-coil protein SlyX